jgi:hypothetical protein
MGFIDVLNRTYNGLAMSAFSRFPPGRNIYTRDWDLLILLDACRVDALRRLVPEYEFMTDVDSHMSLGSSSPEFMAATFTEPYTSDIGRTAYVSGNAHSEFVFENRQMPEDQKDAYLHWTDWDTVDPSTFGLLDHVWRYTERMEAGPCDPKHLIERTIRLGRERRFARVIVHFHQPHAPYVSHPHREGRGPEPHESAPFQAIRRGVQRDKVWNAYLNEIRFIVDQLPLLLKNFEADTAVISADHGELFGKYLYSHPSGLLHPKLRWVPWATVGTVDERTYKATLDRSDEVVHPASERLRELGYIE